MGFMDAYKNLEKLCGEMYGQQNGVSAYIDEMKQTPRGSLCVKNWDEDLENLKHYRWVRNQISHEPNCNEVNMCEPYDTVWLEHFHGRIMNQSDPLALYQKSSVPKKATASQTDHDQPPQTPVATNSQSAKYAPSPLKPRKHSKRVGYLVFLILAFLLALAAFIVYKAHLF